MPERVTITPPRGWCYCCYKTVCVVYYYSSVIIPYCCIIIALYIGK
ncbi:MAG: hypothetical protein IJT36_08240 [Alphaproteobacteria bacterium]|nr:hypothetical protein [Alphaproteobacteria bacterium]